MIPNPARAEYPINLDRERVLKYDFNALILFEHHAGKDLQTTMSESPSLANLRLMLWVGLIHEDPTLTLDNVGDLVQYGSGDTYAEKLWWLSEEAGKAFQSAWPATGAKKKRQKTA